MASKGAQVTNIDSSYLDQLKLVDLVSTFLNTSQTLDHSIGNFNMTFIYILVMLTKKELANWPHNFLDSTMESSLGLLNKRC